MEQPKTKLRSPAARNYFWPHLGLVGFLAFYFSALLFWFGRLFVTGGAEEHVVMSLVIPVVTVLGIVAVMGLLLIAIEGRKAAAERTEEHGGTPDEAAKTASHE